MILAKFSTLRGGVFIEQDDAPEYRPGTRCFRFDEAGRAEFAYYGVLMSNDPAPRWYGHAFTKHDFVLA